MTVTLAAVTRHPEEHRVTPLRRQIFPILLNIAALCLAGRDLSARANLPDGSCLPLAWRGSYRARHALLCCQPVADSAARVLTGELSLWLVTFVFAITAGLGFASTNISDGTLSRASRVTPAVTAAQSSVSDAVGARDRESRGGLGKFCREREAAVIERRQVLDAAVAAIGLDADPQTDAAIKLVEWMSRGTLLPSPEDFGMLRLLLMALMPQLGRLLIMTAGRRG